jgi:non-heme chloroperoxidase
MKFNRIIVALSLLTTSLHVAAQADDDIVFAIEQQARQINDFEQPFETVKSVTLPNGVLLEYSEQGNADGIPVIFLHGFTDSRRSYDLVLPHLPASMHAYAISQRGHGNSARPAKGYHARDFAADIAAFMRMKKMPAAIIVGHSMGSAVAQQFVLDYPQLAKGLVLLGAAASFQKPELVEFAKNVKQLKDPVDASFAKEFQQSTLMRPVPPAFFETVVQESLKLPARVWEEVLTELTTINFVPLLEKIAIPTLIIWGDKDLYCLRADQDALLTGITGSKLLVYEGTGHDPHWEEPARFVKDISEFVSKF